MLAGHHLGVVVAAHLQEGRLADACGMRYLAERHPRPPYIAQHLPPINAPHPHGFEALSGFGWPFRAWQSGPSIENARARPARSDVLFGLNQGIDDVAELGGIEGKSLAAWLHFFALPLVLGP